MLRIHGDLINKKNEEMSSRIDEKEMQRQSRRQQRQTRFLLCITKISQGLQKFRNHRENFAILEKFSLCTNFR